MHYSGTIQLHGTIAVRVWPIIIWYPCSVALCQGPGSAGCLCVSTLSPPLSRCDVGQTCMDEHSIIAFGLFRAPPIAGIYLKGFL